MSRDIVKLLRKTSIFSFLDPTSLNKISEFFKEQTCTSGHIFFRDDTVNDMLYVIRQGAVKIIKTGRGGEGKLSLMLRREGDFFGETALIEETSPLETAQAVQKTKVLQLSRSDFLTIVSGHPFVAFQIMKALTSRLRQSYLGMIEELGEKDEQLKEACAELRSSAGAQTKETEYPQRTLSFPDEVISASPFSLVGTKHDGTIFLFNKAAEDEYGYSAEEVMGKGMDLLRGEGNLSNIDELIKQGCKEKSVWSGEIIAKRKDGQRFISDSTVYTVNDSEGSAQLILWMGKDVTKERSLAREALNEEKLLRSKERIKQVATRLTDQVRLLSDNLNVLTYEANESNLPPWQARLGAMKDALDHLKTTILPLAVHPSPEGVKEPVDLANFIERELFLLRPQKRFEGIDFVTKYDDKLPLVDIEPLQMRQLLIDLLDNAASALSSVSDREKAITLEVRYLPRDQEVEIQILDNGIGISEDHLPKVFTEHFSTKDKGFGFGLFSVKSAVEGHGGTIEVQSIEGAYTLFTIRFPAKKRVQSQERKSSLGAIPTNDSSLVPPLA